MQLSADAPGGGERRMSSIKTVFVGGGSYRWMPKLISDFNRAEALKGSEIALLDIDLAAAREFCAYGEMLAKKHGSGIRHSAGSDEDEAFAGADFIVLTINTGGNEASLLDCEIPRKYGSFQIIGDSAGPGGWIRTWRNAPVFIRMVQKIERLAPNAFVLNYSNPMADLTTILAKASSLRVLGMCHGPLQTRERIAFLFGCAPEAIDMAYAGLNHFHWILRFTVEGREGYAALRRMLNGQTLASCTRRANAIVDDRFENQRLPRFNRKSTMWEDLYEQYGYFCYIAHNHIIE